MKRPTFTAFQFYALHANVNKAAASFNYFVRDTLCKAGDLAQVGLFESLGKNIRINCAIGHYHDVADYAAKVENLRGFMAGIVGFVEKQANESIHYHETYKLIQESDELSDLKEAIKGYCLPYDAFPAPVGDEENVWHSTQFRHLQRLISDSVKDFVLKLVLLFEEEDDFENQSEVDWGISLLSMILKAGDRVANSPYSEVDKDLNSFVVYCDDIKEHAVDLINTLMKIHGEKSILGIREDIIEKKLEPFEELYDHYTGVNQAVDILQLYITKDLSAK